MRTDLSDSSERRHAVEINFTRSPVYEAGAILLSVLAVPENDDTTRGNLCATLCHSALRARYSGESEEAHSLQLMRPVHAFREEKVLRRDLRLLEKRLNERMQAAHVAIPLLHE